MTKTTLLREISKEIEKVNNQIDAKIIRGLAYEKEARRHRNLLATLERVGVETGCDTCRGAAHFTRRSKIGKSPVHRSLGRGVFARLVPRAFAF